MMCSVLVAHDIDIERSLLKVCVIMSEKRIQVEVFITLQQYQVIDILPTGEFMQTVGDIDNVAVMM